VVHLRGTVEAAHAQWIGGRGRAEDPSNEGCGGLLAQESRNPLR
jgi:hypothetical protein